MPFIKGKAPSNTGRTRFKKGTTPWNKGLKGYLKGRKITWAEKISLGKKNSLKSKLASQKAGKKMAKSNLGRKRTEEIKKKLSEAQKRTGNKPPIKRGKESYLWRGGITPANKVARNSLEYKKWRKSVFERDNYTCQICKVRGGYLEADHKKPFAYFLKLRFDLNNGRTLCKGCHKQTQSYMGRARKFEPQNHA